MGKNKNRNIKYKTKELLKFFSANRQKWAEFYPSEKWVFERIAGQNKVLGDILDVGCACGGLGAALEEKFILTSYTGVDINKDVIEWAAGNRRLSAPVKFIAKDVLECNTRKKYDLVTSLSCADWNIESREIIKRCWDRVKEGGYFVISLRITAEQGAADMNESFQYINFSGTECNPEKANYAVFNFEDILEIFGGLRPAPEAIGAYGYWGRPSPTAVTPYKKLVFAVFHIKKQQADFKNGKDIQCEFGLPSGLFRRKKITAKGI